MFDLETHEYLDIKLQGGQKLCDSQTIAPAFYDIWTSFHEEYHDWGNAQDFIQKEGFYMFGGWLAKNNISGELVCITFTKTHKKTFHFKYETIDQKGEIPEPWYGHCLHKYKNNLILFGGVK